MSSAKRAISNTFIIYAKQAITICISLYSTRIVLNTLGANDFGLFNVVGGLVTILSFLNAAMSVSTQRYVAVNLGTGNLENIKKVFANSVILHIGIGLIIALLFEIVGVYFLNHQLLISSDRIEVANKIFHFVVISTFVTIISVPYDAIINAHENMTFLALTSILESIIKLMIAFYLIYTGYDKLLVYGFLTMISVILIRILKQIYVRRKYESTRVNYIADYNKDLIKELTSFAGWNLFGSLSYLGRSQGIALLLNTFYGTVINAAYGIANQIAGQLNFFCTAMLQALNPQIMKSGGAKEMHKVIELSMIGSKVGFLLLGVVAIPCLVEMESVLNIWLKTVPDYTVNFCRLIIIVSMINQLTAGLDSAMQTTGKIRNYMVIVGVVKLFILPVAYILLKADYVIYSVFVGYIILEIIAGMCRVYLFCNETGVDLNRFILEVILKPIFLTTVACVILLVLKQIVTSEYRVLGTFFISFSIFASGAYILILSSGQKESLNKFIISRMVRS
ncbi:hypothetical protein BWI97_19085 [Siphonobacter sp. BAB-5405]|uniref:oligosaccharide flippase family protein n=1 Tax=Siphonobacter sp. BAB-5405 TaxID=1864825 RepID=UPI000C80B3A4|nr:oligosaccharide flippase family protein [Siphonobacter sp. BAB-5405]PMD93032.1 hypothetical protein BWI97_19085 [Siphonobacter sp. BAB-5405]